MISGCSWRLAFPLLKASPSAEEATDGELGGIPFDEDLSCETNKTILNN